MADLTETLRAIAREVSRGGAIALTGAGMSTESGIPDFRSPGGLWERFDPLEYAHIDAFRRDPVKVWRMLGELADLVTAAAPNPAHLALATLERMGLLDGVITQNIDALHQAGGSAHVVEFHGSGRRLRCLRCDQLADAADFGPAERPPRCPRCDAVFKPDAVLFGEAIPARALRESAALVCQARVVLVCGTAAEVYPASDIPQRARAGGATVYEFNLEPALSARVVAGRALGRVGLTLPALVDEVRRLQA